MAEAKAYAAVGVPHHDIAELMGLSIKTLLKHYAKEMRKGKAMANATVGKRLFAQAVAGHGWAVCFWMKCQAGWRETQVHALTDPDGRPLGTALAQMKPATIEQAETSYLELVHQPATPTDTVN